MSKQFSVKTVDKKGFAYLYEGEVMGNPIWVNEKNARPLLMKYEEAFDVLLKYRRSEDCYVTEIKA